MTTQAKRSNGRPRKTPAKQTRRPAAGTAPRATAATETPADQVGSDIDHFQDIRDGAKAIRAAYSDGDTYAGELTVAMMVELEALLEQPTPAQYVKHIGPTEGKPYPSTGLSSIQYQLSMMNAVFGGPHWRALPHYENDGRLCKVVVIVGNRLTQAKLTAGGDLDAGDADVLAVRDGWGAVKRGNTDGDLLKGSYTNAIKRVLAEYGAAADVYRFECDDESVGGVGTGAPRAASRSRAQGGRQGGGARSRNGLEERKLAELIALAKGHDLDQHTLVNIAYALAGKEAVPVDEAEEAFNGLVAHVRANPAYGERLMRAIRDAESGNGADGNPRDATKEGEAKEATRDDGDAADPDANGSNHSAVEPAQPGDETERDRPSSAPDLGQV